jgi:hypothetical protein
MLMIVMTILLFNLLNAPKRLKRRYSRIHPAKLDAGSVEGCYNGKLCNRTFERRKKFKTYLAEC